MFIVLIRSDADLLVPLMMTVCASDNKVLSSFLMKSPGLHLLIFKEKIPGEKYHGRFLSYAFTSRLLLLKYVSRSISNII